MNPNQPGATQAHPQPGPAPPGPPQPGTPAQPQPGTAEPAPAQPQPGTAQAAPAQPQPGKAQAAPAAPPRQHVVRRTRTGGVWVALALSAVVLLLLLIFILENGHRADIAFFGAHVSLPLGAALLLAAVAGALIVIIPGTGRIIQLRTTARRHRQMDAAAAMPGRPAAGQPGPGCLAATGIGHGRQVSDTARAWGSGPGPISRRCALVMRHPRRPDPPGTADAFGQAAVTA